MAKNSTLSRPPRTPHNFRRAAILFAGGPAPAANAVISAAAVSFLRDDIEVVGVKHGYSQLLQFGPDRPLVEGQDYVMIDHKMLRRTRNSQGIIIGTARANPGKNVSSPTHLDDPERVAPLKTVYEALRSIGVDMLVSIGGDDTLKTANKFRLFQERLPLEAPRIPVVHLPKTIDNDYRGIDFTFGDGTLKLEAVTAEIGTSQVELPIPYDGDPITMKMDHRFVADFCKVLDNETAFIFEIETENSPALLSTEDGYAYVIMPMAKDR